jgi:predicted ATPase
LLSGDTGIGKTRILAEAAHQCLEARMVTLGGRCYEQEGRIAYAPIHDALLDYISTQPISLLHAQLDGLPGTIAAIIPEVRSRLRFGDERQPAQTADQRLYLFVAVGQLLERIGQNRPLALFLDDLQWADESSIQLVHFLLRQDRLRCLRLIGAYRADELAPDAPLTKLIGPPGQSDGIDELTLHPFSRTALISLIEAELSARCSGGLVAVLERKSGGNPFFVL